MDYMHVPNTGQRYKAQSPRQSLPFPILRSNSFSGSIPPSITTLKSLTFHTNNPYLGFSQTLLILSQPITQSIRTSPKTNKFSPKTTTQFPKTHNQGQIFIWVSPKNNL
jgi:hypothetical protein